MTGVNFGGSGGGAMGAGFGGPPVPNAAGFGQPGFAPAGPPAGPMRQDPAPYGAAGPGYGAPSSGMGSTAAGGHSTAPVASAKPPVAGLPVSWPVPTSVQSASDPRLNPAVAGVNADIQANAAGGRMAGSPMDPNSLADVQRSLNNLLELSAQDGNMKKKEDCRQRIETLFQRLQAGDVADPVQEQVVALCRAVDAGDLAAANGCHAKIVQIGWDANKAWLQGVKRMMTFPQHR